MIQANYSATGPLQTAHQATTDTAVICLILKLIGGAKFGLLSVCPALVIMAQIIVGNMFHSLIKSASERVLTMLAV